MESSALAKEALVVRMARRQLILFMIVGDAFRLRMNEVLGIAMSFWCGKSQAYLAKPGAYPA